VTDARSRLRSALLPAVALLAAAAVYLNALHNGFALDDVAIIRDNARVHDLRDLRAIWLTPYWPFFGAELGLWRPFAIFAYALQWAAGGGSPVIFHAVSILLHVLVTALVLLLLRRLTATMPAAWGALIFAVHPVHTEAVANVVGQAELIVAAALIGACLVHSGRPAGVAVPYGRAAATAALFAIAILTKEHAVVLPGLLLATDLAQRRVRLAPAAAAAWARALLPPFALIGATLTAYLIVRFHVLEGALLGVQPGPQLHFLHGEFRVLNALRAFPELLRLVVWPTGLAADYAPAMILPVEYVTGPVVIGAILLAALLLLALLMPLAPAAGFPAAWFLIAVSTVSNLFFPIGVLIAERTLFLPSVAVSAALALGIFSRHHCTPPRLRRAAAAGLLAIAAAGAVATWQRNPDWKSTQSILYALMRDHPESYRAQWTHASWQEQLGRPEVARYHYELALRIYPVDSQLLADFGGFLIRHGEPGRGLELLERSFQLHPFMPRTVMTLGTAYLEAGRPDDALRVARTALRHDVAPGIALPIAAAAYDALGSRDRALDTWRTLIRDGALTPREWAALAAALLARGARVDAAAALDRADAAGPDSADARIIAGVRAALDAPGTAP
jgi:Tfp pilus assembly protein PilF